MLRSYGYGKLLLVRSTLPIIATELGADERTLRRAVSRGAVRCRRPGQRRLQVTWAEREYLRGHWPVLSALGRALRTEPNVGLAVLYGSVARGDDGPTSDLDLLVDLREDTARGASALARRLGRALGRDVDVARLNRISEHSPLLLVRALDEGRVIVDRDKRWPSLLAHRFQLRQAADQAVEAERQAAADSLADLLEP
jgi:predicted nucleotidyltransferase